jgi:hypothetical protein
MGVGAQVSVGNGRVFDREGLSFGGRYLLPPDDTGSEGVELAVWAADTEAVHVRLHVDDTFEFDGQTWRLDEVRNRGRRWYATLTRVA